MKIVAVTSCREGFVFTYIAREALLNAASKLNLEIKIETHDAFGVITPLTKDDIKDASFVILTSDKNCDFQRFAHKKFTCVPCAKIIKDAVGVINSIK